MCDDSFRLCYLLNDDIFNEGEGGFFEAMLLHKCSDLGFDVWGAGGLVECNVLFSSLFADIDLYDELGVLLRLLMMDWRGLVANLGS